jgi:hypothetical protein
VSRALIHIGSASDKAANDIVVPLMRGHDYSSGTTIASCVVDVSSSLDKNHNTLQVAINGSFDQW